MVSNAGFRDTAHQVHAGDRSAIALAEDEPILHPLDNHVFVNAAVWWID